MIAMMLIIAVEWMPWEPITMQPASPNLGVIECAEPDGQAEAIDGD